MFLKVINGIEPNGFFPFLSNVENSMERQDLLIIVGMSSLPHQKRIPHSVFQLGKRHYQCRCEEYHGPRRSKDSSIISQSNETFIYCIERSMGTPGWPNQLSVYFRLRS